MYEIAIFGISRLISAEPTNYIFLGRLTWKSMSHDRALPAVAFWAALAIGQDRRYARMEVTIAAWWRCGSTPSGCSFPGDCWRATPARSRFIWSGKSARGRANA
ncbi:MAG: hypothetical protein U0800_27070 [Isosphaeraceae bacterium]